MKKHNQQGSPREIHREIPKRPWGRQIIVSGTTFMWKVSGYNVVIRAEDGYHKVSTHNLYGLNEDYDLNDPLPITPRDIAIWIRCNLAHLLGFNNAIRG